jgi:uncharacterized protein (DUF1330 family)
LRECLKNETLASINGVPDDNVRAMVKAYWITCYRLIPDEVTLAEYARIAGPAIESHGGRFLARGNPAKTYEAGMYQRLVIIEFENVDKAIAAYESPEYQAALALLKNLAERDVRII